MSAQLKLPLVSIVITSYNYAKYIVDALESVSMQSYRPLECIIVDDCSTDNSLEVIHQTISTLEAKDNGIRYSVISTEKNSGQLVAFQLGIQKAEGVFINFLDADDFLFPDFISTHIQVHMENLVAFTFSEPVEIDEKKQIHCFHSNTANPYKFLQISRNNICPLTFNELKKRISDNCNPRESFYLEHNIISHYKTKWNKWYWYPTTTAVFRKNAITHLTTISKTDHWRICADCLLFCFANIIGDSCFVPSSLSAYRRHGKNGFAGDQVVGEYNYLSEKSEALAQVMYNTYLPLALLQLFSSMEKGYVNKSIELAKTLIYQQGPSFLIQNWNMVFSSFPIKCNFLCKLILLAKTYIRYFQYKKRKDLSCQK